MLSLFAICVALCWTFGVSECELGETEHTDAQGNTHCMKLLSTVLRSATPECSIEEQSLWINVAAQSNEIFYMNAAHWNVTDATIGGNIITGLIEARNIADGAITSDKLAVEAVQSSNIADGAITSDKIGVEAVQSTNIAEHAITSSHLEQNGVFNMDKLIVNYIVSDNGLFRMDADNVKAYVTVNGFLKVDDSPTGPFPFNQAHWVDYIKSGGGSEVHNSGSWTNTRISIYATGAIMSNTYVGASDVRIKRNIQTLKDGESLSILRQLDAKSYFYRDPMRKGTKKVIGFIAQEVNETIPTAVTVMSEVIPDEMRLLNATFVSDEGRVEMTLDESLVPGIYRFMVKKSDNTMDKIDLETKDGRKFVVDEEYDEEVFLYGSKVDDFLAIDKQKIFAVAYSALQQVDKNQQALQNKVRSLEATVLELSSRLSNLENQ